MSASLVTEEQYEALYLRALLLWEGILMFEAVVNGTNNSFIIKNHNDTQ